MVHHQRQGELLIRISLHSRSRAVSCHAQELCFASLKHKTFPGLKPPVFRGIREARTEAAHEFHALRVSFTLCGPRLKSPGWPVRPQPSWRLSDLRVARVGAGEG